MKGIKSPEWALALRGWTTRQPKLSLVAGALALALLGWALYVPPCMAIRWSCRRWAGLKIETEQNRNLLDLVRQGKLRPLPSQEMLPELLQQLHVQAKKFQVNIVSISPGGSNAAGPGQPILLPVDLQIEGEYRAIAQFLGALRGEVSLGMVTVRRLQIGREERLLPLLRAQLSIELALKQEGTDEA